MLTFIQRTQYCRKLHLKQRYGCHATGYYRRRMLQPIFVALLPQHLNFLHLCPTPSWDGSTRSALYCVCRSARLRKLCPYCARCFALVATKSVGPVTHDTIRLRLSLFILTTRSLLCRVALLVPLLCLLHQSREVIVFSCMAGGSSSRHVPVCRGQTSWRPIR
jgi:hypothetical protein